MLSAVEDEMRDEAALDLRDDADAILLQRVAAILSMRAHRKRPLQPV